MKNLKLLLAVAACTALPLAGIACGGDDTNATNNTTDSGAAQDHYVAPVDANMPPVDANMPKPDSGKDSGGTDSATDGATTDSGSDAGSDAAVLATGQIDRMGRPAINTALNLHMDTAGGAKDMYNQEANFQNWPANTTYNQNFDTFLHVFDVFGGDMQDWPLPDGGTQHPLREPLKGDFLIIDTNVECIATNNFCENGYLEIEAQLLLGGPAHKTCGGRTPAEDVIDKTLSLLVVGPTRFAPTNTADGGAPVLVYPIGDGVNAPTKPATHTFPYLAAPN